MDPERRCPACGAALGGEVGPCPRCGAPAAALAAVDALETLPLQERDLPPEDENSIGRGFDVREEIGHGGLGTVHAARQRSLDRMVAVKTLRRDGLGVTAIRRFRAEALATAHLEHPNIVPVHDLAVGPDGALLLAMKRIDGLTWQQLLHPTSEGERARAAAMSLDEHLAVLLKVCDGVAFAHARGIVHADLKPANVMIGEYGEVLITDWGCAVAYAPGPPPGIPQPAMLTTLRGSPAYMAPEVARGEITRISPRTDIYLLGATLYEVLTGTPPRQGTDLRRVIAAAASGVIEPPEQRAPGRTLPDELCRLVRAAMQADPRERPRTVREVAARLADYRRHAAAIRLAEAAKAQLALARSSPEASDDHYRHAIASCERAIDMWPEYVAGRDQLAQAQIDYASYALATRAYHLAQTQALAAAAHARTSDRWDLLHRAEDLGAQARRAAVVERRRRRHIALLRAGLGVAVLLCGIGLVLGLVLILAQSRQLQEAARTAHRAAQAADAERARHVSQWRQLRLAGGLLRERAQAAVAQGADAEAAADAVAAVACAPEDARAHQLEVAALALAGAPTQARAALERWLARSPTDPRARQLALLFASIPPGAEREVAPALRRLVGAAAPVTVGARDPTHP